MQPKITFGFVGFKMSINVDSNPEDLSIHKLLLGLWERWLLMHNTVPPAEDSMGQDS